MKNEVYPHLCGGTVENHLGDTTLTAPDQYLNDKIPVIGCPMNSQVVFLMVLMVSLALIQFQGKSQELAPKMLDINGPSLEEK
uniref:Uncharacterized protein n=1 Tax=Timema douglasi TaxID=61478 RepID=A0A7R8VJQ3_TIMDO|nr:unnamed protein product [Timema douglasi]